MSMITGIEISRGMVSVYADSSLALKIRKVHFDKLPLNTGDDIDLTAWENRLASLQFADAWEAALTSLDRAARTEKALRASLARQGFVEPVIDAVIERLKEIGLLDDARYAERMAELQSKRPVGLHAFKRKLAAKGISEDDAAEALAAFDEDQQKDACLAAARSLYRKYENLPRREARAKLSQAL
ncbi:MAG: regulatory protein RecX, partial [bacterium]